MSKLRPTLTDAKPGTPTMRNGTAYLMIYEAVKTQDGLLHGKLEESGWSCAIGSYFEVNPRTALPTDLVDEIAAVNDSVPHKTKRQRKLHVLKWLRWRLKTMGWA